MKKPPTKKELRKELDQQIEAFLNQGGEVEAVKKGQSRYHGSIPPAFNHSFSSSPQKRTLINNVVENLDARKKAKQAPQKATPKQAKRVLIYDDFGEPLRWVWQED